MGDELTNKMEVEVQEEVPAYFDEGDLPGDAADLLNVDKVEGDDVGAEDDVDDPKEKAAKPAEPNQFDQLQAEIAGLKRELSQKDKAKPEPEPDTTFTPAQLKQLMRDHADDPEVLYNIIDHMTKEAAKKGTKNAVASAEEMRRKEEHDRFVTQKYPALSDPASGLRKQVDSIKEGLDIGEHIQGDYMAISCLINEKLPDITKEAYEKGKADALKGLEEQDSKTVDKKVQPGKKKVGLTPDTKTQGNTAKSSFTSSQEETVKKLKMTDAQKKLYASFMKRKES